MLDSDSLCLPYGYYVTHIPKKVVPKPAHCPRCNQMEKVERDDTDGTFFSCFNCGYQWNELVRQEQMENERKRERTGKLKQLDEAWRTQKAQCIKK